MHLNKSHLPACTATNAFSTIYSFILLRGSALSSADKVKLRLYLLCNLAGGLAVSLSSLKYRMRRRDVEGK